MKVINAINFNSQLRKVGRVLGKNRSLLKKLRHQNVVSDNAEKLFSWLRITGLTLTITHMLNPL